MASIATEPNGRRRIIFSAPDGKRKPIRLGKVSLRVAQKYKLHIEDLAAAAIGRAPLTDETARWVRKIGDDMAARLARVGLIPERDPAATRALGPFLDAYVARRTDVKPATREVWGQTVRNLREFFGDDRDMAKITAGECEDFKLYLIGEELASTTISKRISFAKQFFLMARKRGLIEESPFQDVRAAGAANDERQHFITRADAERIMDAANPVWKVIVGLARYGGLRCPSEVLSLRWEGVNWEAGRVTIDSPKGERHGKGHRVIPLFPELRPILNDAWDAAPKGAVYVVDADHYRKASQGPNGWRNSNLRTQFTRILTRAGVAPWPRLFHNLRATRETELAAEYPLHVVTAWLGNTPKIAMRHYLQVTDEDFQRAAQVPIEAPEAARNAARNPAQQVSARLRNSTHGGSGEDEPADLQSGPNRNSCQTLRHSAENCRNYLTGQGLTKNGEDGIRTRGRGYPPSPV